VAASLRAVNAWIDKQGIKRSRVGNELLSPSGAVAASVPNQSVLQWLAGSVKAARCRCT
jgi:hypothetical protein